MLQIVRTRGYPMDFNLPRPLQPLAERRPAYSLAPLWAPAGGIGFLGRVGPGQVAHFWNGIPLPPFEPNRWVVSFESHLPRCLSRGEPLRRLLRSRLTSERCRAIFALSRWAEGAFRRQNEHWAGWSTCATKLDVLPPTLTPTAVAPKRRRAGEPLRVAFVGRNFARKGGIALLRCARSLAAAGAPVHLELVSSLNIGGGAHADAPDRSLYDADLKLLELPNVTHHGEVTNAQVKDILARSDVLALPTLHDTYGFSVLEGYAAALPAVTTNVCALPEINRDGQTGLLLRLAVGEDNIWRDLGSVDGPEGWDVLDATYGALATQLEAAFHRLLDSPSELESMSAGALRKLAVDHAPAPACRRLLAAYGWEETDLPPLVRSAIGAQGDGTGPSLEA